MKNTFLLLLIFLCLQTFAQVEKVNIPKGVRYAYCDTAVLSKAKLLVIKELTDTPSYALTSELIFIGPVLWNRFKDIKAMKEIKYGNVVLHVDNKELQAKMTQTLQGSKKVWDQFRNEIKGKSFRVRKATAKELDYYWSIISFDIEEPLFIIDTKDHQYILNLSPKDLSIVWLDELPVLK